MGIQKLLHKMFQRTKNLANKPLTRMEPRNNIKSQLREVFRHECELYGNPFSTLDS